VEKMRRTLVVLFLALASCAVPITLVRAAEEPKPPATEQKPAEPAEKPLEPGWLSLDSTVGVADNWIALNKSALQDAIGSTSVVFSTALITGVLIIQVIQETSAVEFSTRTTIRSNSITLTSRSTSRKRIGALVSMCPVCLAGKVRC